MSQIGKISLAFFLFISLNQNHNLVQADLGWREVFFEDVLRLSGNPSVLIVDVRTRCEVEESGMIPNAINIPLKELAATLSLSPQDFYARCQRRKPRKNSPIVFYCRTGDRSTEASNIAVGLGYTNVMNYKGGWADWKLRRGWHNN